MVAQNQTLKSVLSSIESILLTQNDGKTYKSYTSLSFLTPISYNLIASFHKKNGEKYKIDKDSFSPSVSTYMGRVGLFRELGINNFWGIFHGGNDNLIEITNISDGNSAEKVSTKFIDKLTKNFLGDKRVAESEILSNTEYCLKELFNNILDHSNDYKSNYSSGHYFPGKYIQFAVVDSGIGIKADISNTFDDISSHKQSIMRALVSGNSGKIKNGLPINLSPYSTKENAGIGLTAVNNILRGNEGDIVIGTGNFIYVYDGETKEEYYSKIPNWNGTFVFFNMYCGKNNIYDYATILKNIREKEDDNLSVLDKIDFNF